MRYLLLILILILPSCIGKVYLQVEDISVVKIQTGSDQLKVIYDLPDTKRSWHCAGAFLARSNSIINLQFIQVHDANSGFNVDLPSKPMKINKVLYHYVEFPYEPNSDFTLQINGVDCKEIRR